jgi:hypothetical protein
VRPVHEIFWTDSLIPRKDFVASPFFNEWMRPAKFGAAAIGANLLVGNEVSSMITVGNAPGKDEITADVFEAVLGHVHRAVSIHRTCQLHDLDHDTAPDQLEQLPKGVMLVDGVATKCKRPTGPKGEGLWPRDLQEPSRSRARPQVREEARPLTS